MKSLEAIDKIDFVILLIFPKEVDYMDREPLILGPFKLRVYIEYLRNELIEIAQKMGLNHQLTIQASEELDFFINEYERINR